MIKRKGQKNNWIESHQQQIKPWVSLIITLKLLKKWLEHVQKIVRLLDLQNKQKNEKPKTETITFLKFILIFNISKWHAFHSSFTQVLGTSSIVLRTLITTSTL